MKYLKKILFLLTVFIMFIPLVYADNDELKDKNLVNIYLFYSESCIHCASEKDVLNEIVDDYDNVRVYKYEVSKSSDNMKLMLEVADLVSVEVSGVPFTIIADKPYKGFNHESSKAVFLGTVEYYSFHGYRDLVGEYLGNVELPSYELTDNNDFYDYIDNYGNHTISFLGFKINTKDLTLPIVSIIIGLVDGFNPCAMWILLFLISMLIGMQDKRRMWTLGLTFLCMSALIYLLFMIAWLKVATFLTSINLVRIVLGLIAITGAIINLYGYFRKIKELGCSVVDGKKRNKIFDRIRKFTSEKNFFLALIGVIMLAISVNIVELACSAGLPVMFIEILSINNLSLVEEIIYIFLYMLFFLLDDFIIFFIAMTTMHVTGFSTKYGKLSKLVGGILLLVVGILLIFKPEWLMFNF